MASPVTPDAFAAALRGGICDRRRIVALAGPPGAGKSTLADQLCDELNRDQPNTAAILPLDGFHLDDQVLNDRGDRARKGAPHTFDLDGYRATLERLRADDGRDVAVPLFDRNLELARAGARVIAGSVRIVLTEGNYLLLDAPGWRELSALFDQTALITASEATLVDRLTRRWLDHGDTPDQLRAKLIENDLPNMRLILRQSRAADVTIMTS